MNERFILPTAEEEREIAEGIASDPDAAPDMSKHHEDIIPRRDLSFVGGQSEVLSLCLDKDIVAHFRSAGPDWRKRINDALRTAAKL